MKWVVNQLTWNYAPKIIYLGVWFIATRKLFEYEKSIYKVVQAEFARGIIDDGCDELDAKESLM